MPFIEENITKPAGGRGTQGTTQESRKKMWTGEEEDALTDGQQRVTRRQKSYYFL